MKNRNNSINSENQMSLNLECDDIGEQSLSLNDNNKIIDFSEAYRDFLLAEEKKRLHGLLNPADDLKEM